MATDGRPAQPKSILRGHKAQVHAAAFVRGNERLVTGDADGFVIAWDLAIMRPRAVWQAHDNAILGIAGLGRDRLITHGRDNKLIVWKFTADEEMRLSTCVPLDVSPEPRPQPWMFHMLTVNTMNFCAFSHCPASPLENSHDPAEVLVAVPNTLASEAIDIFHLPSQTLQHTIKLGEKNGMVMALSLLHLAGILTLVAGYENGMAMVAQLDPQGTWNIKYQAQPHSQPILSLDVSPSRDYFLTSGADAIIAKHPLPPAPTVPLPATPTTPLTPADTSKPTTSSGCKDPSKSLLAAALSNSTPPAKPTPAPTAPDIQTQPLKKVNTKHAGQQSLRIRSDNRVFATAGWDSRVRVYSTKTLAEVAVLKWHAVGCYAAAFAEVDPVPSSSSSSKQVREKGELDSRGGGGEAAEGDDKDKDGEGVGSSKDLISVPKLVAVTVSERRIRQARTAHWLAGGSKDGKVSVWDVF
ncbi:hypothetical protein VTJ49DRAFT_4909 [Mycothermus thermophilus]|uniref:ASTRA-associated protein 1 n=1 Tax=Humicola insolens TaxID=85995 RepID=A0ABR3V473_HUMIN